jgi:TatD DNase family protein
MIDTHCHLTFRDYTGRVDQVVAEAAAAGVRGMITVSTTSADCARSLELATQSDRIWCTAGIHPLHSDEPRDWLAVRAVGEHPRCVAWGELGLDYHYTRPPRPLQHEVLAEQLDHIARWESEATPDGFRGQWPKAIVVHCRDAFDDLLAIFRDAPFDPARFVFHCFTGTPADARKVLDFGATISFTGVVTFKNAPEVAEAAKLVPLERIMVETDAPFLSPEPVRKERPNHPKHVVHIARSIADLRGLDHTSFERQLDANAERFFGITLPPAER